MLLAGSCRKSKVSEKDEPGERSRIMARVRSAHTGPEIAVRKLLYALGYRYRLHARELPGKPDVVFRSRRKVIFINGCFWHQHSCKRGRRIPKTRRDYWLPKLRGNRRRDAVNLNRLKISGWSTLVIWECQLSDLAKVARRLREHLGGGAAA